MRFARSGGSLEHDVQPLAEVVSGVEACDHAPVEPALLHQVDGPQVRLGIAQSRAFDQALDPGVHVTGVRAVDGEPDHLSVAQWHGGLFVEAFERVEQVRGVHLAQLAFGLGVDGSGAADVFLEIITQPFLGFDGIVPGSSNQATV